MWWIFDVGIAILEGLFVCLLSALASAFAVPTPASQGSSLICASPVYCKGECRSTSLQNGPHGLTKRICRYSGSLNIREADLAQQHKTFGSPFIWWWRKIEEIYKMIFLAKNRQYICQLRYITLILIVSLLLQALKAQFFVIFQFSSTTSELRNNKKMCFWSLK